MNSMQKDKKIRVRFVTRHDEFRIADTPFAVPANLGRSGLSEVINHLLDLETKQPFDFMINTKLIRLPLYKFTASNHLSTEDLLEIEYFPAVSLSDEHETTEAPGWVGSLDTNLTSTVVGGCYNGSVTVLNLGELDEKHSFEAHEEPVRAVVCWDNSGFNENISLLATGSKDQTIKYWNITNREDPQLVTTLSGHMNSVESIGLSKTMEGKNLLVSGDWSGSLFGWNIEGLNPNQQFINQKSNKRRKKSTNGEEESKENSEVIKPLFSLKAHNQSISDICMGELGFLYTSSWDHSLKKWDLEKQDCISTFVSSKVITSLDKTPTSSQQSLLVSSHPDGAVRLWDCRIQRNSESDDGGVLSSNSPQAVFFRNNEWISQVRWKPNSDFLFAATDYSGVLTVWDMRANKVPIGSFEAHEGKALSLAWGSEDKEGNEWKLVSGGSDCEVCISELKC